MSDNLPAKRNPEHPPTQYLGAEEIEAIKIARRGLPEAMRSLIGLTRSKSESQRRQAIELLFSHGLANRQQQFDMATHEPVGDKDGQGATNISLTLNKVELRLTEIMQNMPPHLAVEFAEFVEKIEREAADINMPIIDGDDIIVEAVEEGPPCECGCKEPVKRLRSGPNRGEWAHFVHGHHLRGHMSHKRIPPKEIMRLKAAGQWPPRDADGKILQGYDKGKTDMAGMSKKERIKAKKEAARKAAEQ